MAFILRIKNVLLKHVTELRWYTVFSAVIVFVFLSWVLMSLCGEKDIIQPANFLYWLVVTGSTVGYGDYSPVTPAGKLVTSLFVIPFGLGLFAVAVGQVASFFSFRWSRGIKGLKVLDYEKHILVLGWSGVRTIHLLNLLLREQRSQLNAQKVALCVMADIENPMPGDIGFIKVRSFTDKDDMRRAAVDKASCIIIDNVEDDVTLTSTLFCGSVNANAHTIAHFREESVGKLLKQHCPNVECTPSVSVEMMAKSAVDPGSSSLHHQLLNVDEGTTQYSVTYAGQTRVTVKYLFMMFKEVYAATLIGLSEPNAVQINLNPDLAIDVEPGTILYYIADERIEAINWGSHNV